MTQTMNKSLKVELEKHTISPENGNNSKLLRAEVT